LLYPCSLLPLITDIQVGAVDKVTSQVMSFVFLANRKERNMDGR